MLACGCCVFDFSKDDVRVKHLVVLELIEFESITDE